MINRKEKGFTLIELMIVVAIVAILVALALPSFRDVIRKSRRSDAFDSITHIQLAQERRRVNVNAYTTNLTGAPPTGLGILATSSDGHYTLGITAASATNYTIVATAVGDQANDSCGNFTFTKSNAAGQIVKTASGGAGSARCWTK